MSQDDVLTLIRLARKYPTASDALLAAAERIGSNGAGRHQVGEGEPTATAAISFPIEIQSSYKGHVYRGILDRDRTVTVNGKKYQKPSPAAMSITGNSVNGWAWWWYRDPARGRLRQIKELKERGII